MGRAAEFMMVLDLAISAEPCREFIGPELGGTAAENLTEFCPTWLLPGIY